MIMEQPKSVSQTVKTVWVVITGQTQVVRFDLVKLSKTWVLQSEVAQFKTWVRLTATQTIVKATGTWVVAVVRATGTWVVAEVIRTWVVAEVIRTWVVVEVIRTWVVVGQARQKLGSWAQRVVKTY